MSTDNFEINKVIEKGHFASHTGRNKNNSTLFRSFEHTTSAAHVCVFRLAPRHYSEKTNTLRTAGPLATDPAQ